jgi:polysaccharide export outer membrane protein
MRSYIPLTLVIGLSVVLTAPASSQAAQTNTAPSTAEPKAPVSTGTGYVIGAQDVLSVVFWRDKDMSADVVVRPDGNISLPLLNEIPAAGLTPEQLRARLTEAAAKFVEDPTATVVVKEIHSRNVYITGNVAKPATYSLMGDMTVLQLIAMAGGLQEYADAKSIVIIRAEGGRQQYHNFNYKDVVKQKHVEQNIVLKPGDTVVVP